MEEMILAVNDNATRAAYSTELQDGGRCRPATAVDNFTSSSGPLRSRAVLALVVHVQLKPHSVLCRAHGVNDLLSPRTCWECNRDCSGRILSQGRQLSVRYQLHRCRLLRFSSLKISLDKESFAETDAAHSFH